MIISGCKVSSLKIPFYKKEIEVFLLKNGIEEIPVNPSLFDRTNIIISAFTKLVTNYTDQGFYQCAVKIHGAFARTITSKNADVQFIGEILIFRHFTIY